MKIITNEGNRCDGQIFNIGNPDNELTIKELAHKLSGIFQDHPSSRLLPPVPDIVETSSGIFYGNGYQDIGRRVPSIRKARELLGWEPQTDVDTALKRTVAYYLDTNVAIE
jgi:UDP-4-amino-4-deoxy-L-arabinose formyltransferase/UDP-glucuronic acid dehydrogenase (UDP-4-keto-hexauronic acid decarboxylating)